GCAAGGCGAPAGAVRRANPRAAAIATAIQATTTATLSTPSQWLAPATIQVAMLARIRTELTPLASRMRNMSMNAFAWYLVASSVGVYSTSLADWFSEYPSVASAKKVA